MSMSSPEFNDSCPVCLERYNIPCQANCSHWFCGTCILNWWHRGPGFQATKCPICRRSITLLVPLNDVSNQQGENSILRDIGNYNRQFGGEPLSLSQRLRDLPFYIRRLSSELMNPQRTLPIVFRARMIFAMVVTAIYVLSPVDFLPEGALGFVGFLDDLLVLLLVAFYLAAIYRQVLLYRHGGH